MTEKQMKERLDQINEQIINASASDDALMVYSR